MLASFPARVGGDGLGSPAAHFAAFLDLALFSSLQRLLVLRLPSVARVPAQASQSKAASLNQLGCSVRLLDKG